MIFDNLHDNVKKLCKMRIDQNTKFQNLPTLSNLQIMSLTDTKFYIIFTRKLYNPKVFEILHTINYNFKKIGDSENKPHTELFTPNPHH